MAPIKDHGSYDGLDRAGGHMAFALFLLDCSTADGRTGCSKDLL
ncbi:hypothetical protein Egran_03889, partial [Elaphomyces granulatus]